MAKKCGLRNLTIQGVIGAVKSIYSGRLIVIAHSLVSIVICDILIPHPEIQVDLLVTVGSPLCMDRFADPRREGSCK